MDAERTKLHQGSVNKTESDVLSIVSPYVHDWKGTSVNIQLVNVTNPLFKLNPIQMKDDPAAKSGNILDLPCYWVTIGGVNISSEMNPNLVAHELQMVVDAYSGDILDTFAVSGT